MRYWQVSEHNDSHLLISKHRVHDRAEKVARRYAKQNRCDVLVELMDEYDGDKTAVDCFVIANE